MARIQFILKHRDNPYNCDAIGSGGAYLSSGLFNSARLVEEMLRGEFGYDCELVHAVDNNSIDALVTRFKPDVVVIEAYWVVPEKFAVLTKLHPRVTWVIRNHSAMSFASTEGIIIDWSLRYMDYCDVVLACNDPRADREFAQLIRVYKGWNEEQVARRCVNLPNYYPVRYRPRPPLATSNELNVGCFGAIRPLKNQLIQAVAAIEYAERVGKHLNFHVNGTRVEGRGDAALNNIRALFDRVTKHRLVEHPWLSNEDFLALVRTMDVGLQVSYSESFNIVAADFIMSGVPIVVSPEIRWVQSYFHVDPNDSTSIVEGLGRAIASTPLWRHQYGTLTNLRDYDEDSAKRWNAFIKQVVP